MEKKDKDKISLKATRSILMIAFVGYHMMGAKIFQILETDVHEELKNSTLEAKAALMKNYANITPEELEIFLQKLTFSVQKGINPVGNGSRIISWDFKNSFFFVESTLYTIGYGTLVPRSPSGQIFCVFYAFLGIPLTIIFLNFVSRAISRPFTRFGKHLQNKGIKERKIKIYTLLFFLVMGLLIFILLPPLIFINMEGWNYKEGLYFAFITLSTIGFGDYVVGVNPTKKYPLIYQLIIILWCVTGLTWIALLFDLFTKILENTERKLTLIPSKMLSQKESLLSMKSSLHFWSSLDDQMKSTSQHSSEK
ncbi:potassium channel, subfamily K, member 16-like isoform X2 [Dasypus novemcinctus]|uniref:potassium channel, subfamily K, member 16-like isoform X2 n=1 Tax=Dasypus novemcinctus TaxID=9361 RepID=UPI00265E65F6|nr:potassium channel subfamily K member 16-like [Dasypus novemcinctus]